MKTIYGIFILIVAVLFFSACTQSGTPQVNDLNSNSADTTTEDNTNSPASNEEQTAPDTSGPTDSETPNEPEDNTEIITSGKIPMSQIYNYAAVTNFEYDITSNVGGVSNKMNLKYVMSADTLDGKDTWLLTTEAQAQGANVLQKTWLDKTTYGCIKYVSTVSYNGQTFDTPGECAKEGPNAESSGTETPMVDYVGDESVTVPLGTYSTKKYSLEGITYYYADSVPIPVKVTYSNSATVMELVSWS